MDVTSIFSHLQAWDRAEFSQDILRVFVIVPALTIVGGVNAVPRKLGMMAVVSDIATLGRGYPRSRASDFPAAVGGHTDPLPPRLHSCPLDGPGWETPGT